MPKIIAGMPAYNEGKYIGTLVLQTRQHVDEVIVVDDGSTDATAEIAELAGARVIKHETNLGYGAAIQSIFAEAKKLDPDVLVILDADAQHSPKEIPNLVKSVIDGYDCVIGSRHEHGEKIPLYRRVGQRVILRSVKALSADKLTDSECGFRAFSRKAVQTLDLRETGMAVSAETVAEASQKNLKVIQVPVSVNYAKDSSTLHPVRHGLSVITRIFAMISDQRPLFFFGVVGLISIIIGLVFGIRVIVLFTDYRVLPTGNTLVTVLLIVLGLMFVFTGFVLSALQPGIHKRGLFSRIVTKISEPHPLLYFGTIGLVLVIVGLVFGVRVFSLYAENGVLPTGTALVSVVFLIMGMFSIFAGLILRGFAQWRK
ncbi:MAG: glycosyltransferase [Dehalococcoidales bacterium]|nr:glycosyltransferase [Dehalococcoidales bacterium]